MSVVIKSLSYLKGKWYAFQSNPILHAFARLCVFCEPFTLGLAAFVIVEFFNRVGTAYKSFHKSGHLRLNWFNLSIFIIPLFFNLYYYHKVDDNSLLTCLFSFTFTTAVLSLGIPIIVQRKTDVGGSFFQITLIFSAFYFYNFKFIYYFWISIPMAFMVFKNENKGLDRFRRVFVAPYLLVSFLGILISCDITAYFSGAICIIVGSFFGNLLS